MRKILIVLLFVLSFGVAFAPMVFADETDVTYVFDDTDVLTNEEYWDLNDHATEISEMYECAVMICITGDIEGYDDVVEYSQDLYTYSEWGFGEGKSGILLFLSTELGECTLTTYGDANTIFDEETKNMILDDIFIPLFAEGENYSAFEEYLITTASVLGYENEEAVEETPIEESNELNYVTDDAALLTEEQWVDLETKAMEIASKYQCEVYIIAVDDMYEFDFDYANDENDALVFNESVYSMFELGYGSDKSCLILCMSMKESDYCLSPYGYGQTVFTSAVIDSILDDNILPFLESNAYYEAFSAYLDKADEYLASDGDVAGETDDLGYIIDVAELLTASQFAELEAKATSIANKYQCGVYVVTVEDMYNFAAGYEHDDGDAYVFNKYFRSEFNLGYGSDKSCLILCLSMKERDYWLEPYGYGKTAFTRHGIDVMLDKHMLPLLKENKYYGAFSAYLDKAEEYLDLAKNEAPFDTDTDPAVAKRKLITKLVVVFILPLLIAFAICSVWKRQMKTAKIAKTADNYIPQGGFKLTGQQDLFLYQTTTRTKIESSSSGGGSSSGSSGRGGKF